MLNFPRGNVLASSSNDKLPSIHLNQTPKSIPEIALPGPIFLFYTENTTHGNAFASPLSDQSFPLIPELSSQLASPSVVLSRDEAHAQLKQNRKFIKDGLFLVFLTKCNSIIIQKLLL